MKYIEIDFSIVPDSQVARDLVAALAGMVGVNSFCDDEKKLKGYIQSADYDEERLKTVLLDLPLEGVKISFSATDVEDKDWNAEWEKTGFEPIPIDGQCLICHVKDQEKILNALEWKAYPQKIWIEPRQAFGSGTHETTQMMVSMLLSMDLKGKRVLDCGCGTGILGIVAAKAGADEVVAYDIDEWSVENAKQNARLNNVVLEVLEGDRNVLSHVCGQFSVVFANINRNILLDDMETFVSVMNLHSSLIISGFYKDDIPLLEDKAKSLELTLQRQKENQNWCCLAFEWDQGRE